MPEMAVEAYLVMNFFQKLGFIIPKNSFLLHFFSVHLIVKHFELIDINKLKFSNVKNHTIASDGTTFEFYKELVEKEKYFKLSIMIVKKLFKDWVYKYKSYFYFIYYLYKRKYR